MFLNIDICVSAAGVGGSARPLRRWSKQSCMRHVNKTSVQLQDPRLWAHRVSLDHSGTKENLRTLMQMHSGLKSFSSRVLVCVLARTQTPLITILLHQRWSYRIKSSPAAKMTTNLRSLRGFKGRNIVDLSQQWRREGLFAFQVCLWHSSERDQIDAELLTDSNFPNRRMMMGLICCATTKPSEGRTGHISHSFTNFSLRISDSKLLWASSYSSPVLASIMGICRFFMNAALLLV